MTSPKFPPVTLWMAYLAVGAGLLLVHRLLDGGTLPQSLLYDVVGASAVAVALIGVWRNRPERRLPWILMAFGQALFVAGDLLWNWYEVIGEDPFPSLAEAKALGKGRYHVFDAAGGDERPSITRSSLESGPTVRRTSLPGRLGGSRLEPEAG